MYRDNKIMTQTKGAYNKIIIDILSSFVDNLENTLHIPKACNYKRQYTQLNNISTEKLTEKLHHIENIISELVRDRENKNMNKTDLIINDIKEECETIEKEIDDIK